MTVVSTNVIKLKEENIPPLHFRPEKNNRGLKFLLVQKTLEAKGSIDGDDKKSAVIDYMLDKILIEEHGTLDLSNIKQNLE